MGADPCPPPPLLSLWPMVQTAPCAVAMAEWRDAAMEVTWVEGRDAGAGGAGGDTVGAGA